MVLKIIRSIEWWEYKLPPLLAIGYATIIKSKTPFIEAIPQLLFLLLSLIIGAAYVSIINDITDIKDDLASGKHNRIAGIKPSLRWILPAICLLAGIFFVYLLYPDRLSVFLYTMPWICFSLYSFRPVRLKNRGIWGVLADASGSHVFTSLLMVSSLSYTTTSGIDWWWFGSTGVWALCYGLRGILWHQFYDRNNDLEAGIKTFAVGVAPHNFRLAELIIFGVELAAISLMLFSIHELLPMMLLMVYIIVALTRSYKLKYKPVIIIAPEGQAYHILMADFYQVYFPLSLLFLVAWNTPYAFFVLIIHFLSFPVKTIASLKDLKSLITSN